MPRYAHDLAYIQAAGFGDFAQRTAPGIVRRLSSAAIPIRRVLDAGCGAGPLSKLLVEAGFEVIGIDASEPLLAIARAAVPQARFIHGSLYEVDLPPCEAILAIGEPLTYHSGNASADSLLRSFFQNASATLPRGGLLIFDVIETGEPPLSGKFWSAGEDWAVLAETTEHPEERRLVRTIETFRRAGDLYRRGREVHQVRAFETQALTADLNNCGFTVETAVAYGDEPLFPRRRAFFATRL